MPKKNNIISVAQGDVPVTLETDALDAVFGGGKYVGPNTIEPVMPRMVAKDGRKSSSVEMTWKIEEGDL